MTEPASSQQRYTNKVWSQLAQQKKKTNELSSKAFFNSIKAELTNIRSDVNKLVGTGKDTPNKSYVTPSYQTNGVSSSSKFTGSGYNYINRSQGSSKDIQSTRTRTSNINLNSMTPSIGIRKKCSGEEEDRVVQKETRRQKQEGNKEKDEKPFFSGEQIQRRENKIKELNQKVREQMNMLEQKNQEVSRLTNQINRLNLELTGCKQENVKFHESLQNAQLQINKMEQSLKTSSRSEQQIQSLRKQIKEKDSMICNLSQELQQTSQNQHAIITQLTEQLQLKSKHQQTQNSQNNQSYQKLSKQLNIKSEQISNLTLRISSLQRQVAEGKQKVVDAEKKAEQIERMKNYEIVILRNELEDCKSKQVAVNQTANMRMLGQEYENKINQFIEENYSLKNRITHLQNLNDHSDMRIKSLESTIQAYEERDRDDNYGEKAQRQQNEDLKNKVVQLQQQIDRMESDHQFQIMKFQNKIDQLKEQLVSGTRKQQSTPLNQILKDQITQIENLRAKLREKNDTNPKFK